MLWTGENVEGRPESRAGLLPPTPNARSTWHLSAALR